MSAHSTEHTTGHYVKIWAILLVLLIVSICGPMAGIRAVTLITAFGIAIVKATMVAGHFMHLNVERRFVWYILLGMLLLVGVFFAAVSVDVMTPGGSNWIRIATP